MINALYENILDFSKNNWFRRQKKNYAKRECLNATGYGAGAQPKKKLDRK